MPRSTQSGVLLGLAMAVVSQALPAAETPLDRAITVAVAEILAADERLHGADLHITTRNGRVHIQGLIPETELLTRLIELAESVDGVTDLRLTLHTHR